MGSGRDEQVRTRAVFLAGLAVVAGAMIAWWRHDPWPAQTIIRPSTDSYSGGFSADGKTYMTVTEAGPTAWDVATGAPVALPPPGAIHLRVDLPDGGSFVGVREVGWPRWELVRGDAAGGETRVVATNDGDFRAAGLALVDGGRAARALLSLGRWAVGFQTWDLATGRVVADPPRDWMEWRLTRDGRFRVMLINQTCALRAWDIARDVPVGPWFTPTGPEPMAPAQVTLGGEGRTLVVPRGRDRVEVWDAAAGRLVRTFAPHNGRYPNDDMELTPDGRILITSGYDMGPYSPARRLWGRVQGYLGMTGPPDRETVAVDLATGAILARARGSSLDDVSPDGRWLATREGDGTIAIRALPRPAGGP